jgi:hypothetical protein
MTTAGRSPGELDNATIALESPAYFHAPDGSEVHLHAGSHRVEFGPDGHLHVGSMQKGEGHGRPLRTLKFWHAFSLTAPLAVSVAAEHDSLHIVLLLAGGGALQSTGSLRPTARLADTPTFVTPHDLAQAIIMKFPDPLSPHHSFNAATVLSTPGTRSLWATIEPGSHPSTFVPVSVPPQWISTTVTACKAAPGAYCPGVGTPVLRNPPAEPQLVSTTPVIVKSLLSWAGQSVVLFVTAQVVNTGGPMRYMTWTDVYRQVPTTNGPLTFPGVIVANGTPPPHPPPPGRRTWEEETAFDMTSPSGRGAPTEFELHVNGITQAFRSCEYLGHFPGGTPELRCS